MAGRRRACICKGKRASSLGIAMSAQLVEMMGGTITIESVPGAGSTFMFTARLELVLLDLPMPGMDGFEFAGRVRDDPAYSGVVIIVLASTVSSEDATRMAERI